MPPQGEVARQWFIPGEGIDRHVISADIQRYLGNDATVRPGVGTGDYQGINGYWIKAYRNLTSAMIADLRADSQRWRQEQRQTGTGDSYVGSRTYDESNAARVQRRDRDSPSLDVYNNPAPPRLGDGGRPVDPRRPPMDPMQVDAPAGRAPPGQGYGQPGYYPPDARGQYPPDPSRYPPQGRGQGYPQDQAMVDAYGPPDVYGRFPANPPYSPDRPAGYGQPGQAPQGYTRSGEFYVPNTSGYNQAGMPVTSGPEQYTYEPQQAQQRRGPEQPSQRDPRAQPGYSQGDYAQDPRYAYPSPAQTVSSVNPNPRDRDPVAGQGQASGYAPAQTQYDQYGRPVASQYPSDPGYAPQQARNPNPGRQPPAPQGDRDRGDRDRRHRRNG